MPTPRAHAPIPVVLRKNLARTIRRGHPWVYGAALTTRPPLPDGQAVTVTTRDGRPLGSGFWDARSPIAVRLLSSEPLADPAALVPERLRAALRRRLAFIDLRRTDAFRWVHGEADLLAGVHVDLYGGVAAVRFDGGGARAFYRALAQQLPAAAGDEVPLTSVIERRSSGRAAAVIWGRAPSRDLEVRENGLRFGVDPLCGQKGGLFLDQRDNRAAVAARASGRTLLDLFGYTGAFSVYAAAAGARLTVTVDAAAPALAATRRNFERNRLPLDRTRFERGDVFELLGTDVRRAHRERYDIVVSDPPSFAPSRAAIPAARRAYRRLHGLAAQMVAPGGVLCAASCSSHTPRDELLRSVEAAVAGLGRRWTLLEDRGAAADHPVIASFPEGDYLKFLVGRVE